MMQNSRKLIVLWSLVGLAVVLTIAYLVLLYLNRDTFIPASWAISPGVRQGLLVYLNEVGYILAMFSLTSVLGVLIVYRRPDNPIGWLLVLLGLISALIGVIREATIYANFTRSPPLGNTGTLNLLQNQVWVWLFGLLFLLIAIFPDGKLPPRRWRWILGAILTFILGITVSTILEDTLLSAFNMPNPLDLPAWSQPLFSLSRVVGFSGFIAAPLGLAGYSIARFRKAQGVLRQQYKWFGLAVLFTVVFALVGLFLGYGLQHTFGQLMTNYAVLFVPLGIGIAVLRLRLYDIDVIIRRTLIYSSLSASLVIVFFGSVVFLQGLLRVLTGQESPLVIVLSTLAIAASFNPLRYRLQHFIDRRFYRTNYDAERALAEFAKIATNETDMHALTGKLIKVVDETMQPDSIMIWLHRAEE